MLPHRRAGGIYACRPGFGSGAAMSANVQKIIDRTIGVEGRYSANLNDRGGPTCWGISRQVARAYGYTGDMRTMPRPIAVEIYRKRYWEEPGLARVGDLAPNLAAELFDTGVNMGTSVPGTFLQRVLNVMNRQASDYPDIPVDGRIGTMSIASLSAFLKVRGAAGENILIKACDALQGARYIGIAESDASQEAFVFGWVTNRVGAGQ